MKKALSVLTAFSLFILIFPMLVNLRPPAKNEITLTVLKSAKGETQEEKLEEYLVGVVAGEMPASFEKDALMAQAVAARTYIYKKIKDNKEKDGHSGATVCDNPGCCKAYAENEELKEKWGADFEKYYKKVESAVKDTENRILVYENEPISAVFHSMSNKRTENSEDVWGSEYPYLKSVESGGEDMLPNNISEVAIAKEDFMQKIKEANEKAIFQNSAADIGNPVYNEGGSIKSITIGGADFTGVEIRSMFGLKSADFEINLTENDVVFTVYGYGHGVGMSQYGANELAKQGLGWEEILLHYYQGTKISEI